MEIINLEMSKRSHMHHVSDALALKLINNGFNVQKVRIGKGAQYLDVHVVCGADEIVTDENVRNIIDKTFSQVAMFNTTPPTFIDESDKIGIQEVQSQLLRAYSFIDANWMDVMK